MRRMTTRRKRRGGGNGSGEDTERLGVGGGRTDLKGKLMKKGAHRGALRMKKAEKTGT